MTPRFFFLHEKPDGAFQLGGNLGREAGAEQWGWNHMVTLEHDV